MSRRDWAPGLSTLRVEADVEPFSPGQFVNLSVEGAADEDRRSYSIASPPGAPTRISRHRSRRWKAHPEAPRARTRRSPCSSSASLRDFSRCAGCPPRATSGCVATGTGLGPFLSMLKGNELWERFERVVVVHGVRDASHLAHRDDLVRLGTERRALTVVGVISRGAVAAPLLSRSGHDRARRRLARTRRGRGDRSRAHARHALRQPANDRRHDDAARDARPAQTSRANPGPHHDRKVLVGWATAGARRGSAR